MSAIRWPSELKRRVESGERVWFFRREEDGVLYQQVAEWVPATSEWRGNYILEKAVGESL